jgi:flavin reductase (DIM6/NTAB) family NADH-FMN oxidoreductase RutF/DNA-binding GntR family transcriptional regulator
MTVTARRLDGEAFREVVGHFASGVTIVTTEQKGKPLGTTASAFTSLSLEPPMVVVCMNRESATGKAVLETGRLGVNILGEDHAELAMKFARSGGDKFADVALASSAAVPLLEDCLATLICRVRDHIAAATHYVFLAEVDEADAVEGSPLAYYRGRFGRLELDEDRGLLREIRASLLAGTLGRDDEALRPETVSTEIGAASGPTYHALSRLAAEGLLERGRDGFIPRAAPDEVLADVFAARRAIELGVARETVGKVRPDQLSRLRELMEKTSEMAGPGGELESVDGWIEANAAFHEEMVALSGSSALIEAYRGLGLRGLDARRLPQEPPEPGLVEDHRDLVDAYERADLDAACSVIERHLTRFREMGKRRRTREENE